MGKYPSLTKPLNTIKEDAPLPDDTTASLSISTASNGSTSVSTSGSVVLPTSEEPHEKTALPQQQPQQQPQQKLLKRQQQQQKNHRRSQTIMGAGEVEREQIEKKKQVEVLNKELEHTTKALEESQEEAQLAARIGQTLLQRNQEMDEEIHYKTHELLERAETAESDLKVIQLKFAESFSQLRGIEIQKKKALHEVDQLAQEVEDLRLKNYMMKDEVQKAKEEAKQAQRSQQKTEEQASKHQQEAMELRSINTRLLIDVSTLTLRIKDLETSEQYLQDHLQRLEIENQSLCSQHHVRERKEHLLGAEVEAMALRLAAQTQLMKEVEESKSHLIETISSLQREVQELKDSFESEQNKVDILTTSNQELQDQLDLYLTSSHHSQGGGDNLIEGANVSDAGNSVNLKAKLRSGSLFHELSKHLEGEIKLTRSRRSLSGTGNAQTTPKSSTVEQTYYEEGEEDDEEDEEQQAHQSGDDGDSTSALQVKPRLKTRSGVGTTNSTTTTTTTTMSSCGNMSSDTENILKEFFLLTASAVKIAGYGLVNDRCNISNEMLFEEAERTGITFEQYHHWLEERLGGISSHKTFHRFHHNS